MLLMMPYGKKRSGGAAVVELAERLIAYEGDELYEIDDAIASLNVEWDRNMGMQSQESTTHGRRVVLDGTTDFDTPLTASFLAGSTFTRPNFGMLDSTTIVGSFGGDLPGSETHSSSGIKRQTSVDLESESYLDGLPPSDPESRPHYDLVVAVFVVGGSSEQAQNEIALVRKLYGRYGSHVLPQNGSEASDATPLTLKLVFIVGREGLDQRVQMPAAGILLGDFLHVDVREGYEFLGDKTKAMMGLAKHLRYGLFPFWLPSDSYRVIQQNFRSLSFAVVLNLDVVCMFCRLVMSAIMML